MNCLICPWLPHLPPKKKKNLFRKCLIKRMTRSSNRVLCDVVVEKRSSQNIWLEHHFPSIMIWKTYIEIWNIYITLKRYTLLPEGTDVHIQHNHQKDLNLCLSLYCYGNVIVELEKSAKNEFYCIYGACNLAK